MDKYTESSENIIKVIDIAIDVFRNYPPKIWNMNTVNQIINTYIEFKERVQNPEPEFRNLKSLKYLINDVFIYFQESSGYTVELFWRKIKESNLPYKRENKLDKILKRKKINNQIEYDFILDVLVPYQQEHLIGNDDVILLNQLMQNFESNKK